MQDFLGHFQDTNVYPAPKNRSAKFYLRMLLLLAGLGIIFYFSYFAVATYIFAERAKTSLEHARSAVASADFTLAENYLVQSAGDFSAADSAITKLGFIGYLPLIKNDYAAARGILIMGKEVTSGLKGSSEIIKSVLSDFKDPHELNLTTLSPADKQKILERIGQGAGKINDVKDNLSRAATAYRGLPSKSIFGLEQLVMPYGEKFLELESTMRALLSLMEVFPRLAGFPEARTYLFLLQNNTELRPAGGFIGAYGVVKLDAGEIKSFFTDDSYALDRKSVGRLKIAPPDPLKKYLNLTNLYLRDSNWSPDFSVSAAAAEDFYYREGGTEKLNGVIAITPDVVSGLLRILGPIKVEDQEFTADNLTEALEYRVEVSFQAKGIPRAQRKEIIGVMAKELLQKIYSLPLRDWASVLSSVAGSLDQKHLLLTSADPEVQKVFDEENWSGKVKDTASDYLMVVDANLNGLKSDPEVSREVSYTLSETKTGKFIGEVKIKYQHSGVKDYKTGRYRDYVRVYAPIGSHLIYFGDGESDKTSKVDVADDLGKTSFGFFTTVEVGGTRELTFRYELPERVKYQIEQNLYSILIQKQPGIPPNRLTLNLNFDKNIATAPGSGWQEGGGKIFRTDTDLSVDRMYSIGF